ncbi:hypothetical protein IFM89_001921 [Coptis chinensis]|uniref:PORR domain-containing protein n=1 Tax=Coptis chinensis TaxID=261450 RepID=A0A835M475_9MAGN|nr:hypothetical protein IFM89_001921 [Coptis chinensis]
MNFPSSFRPNVKYLEEVQKWQKMPFPSPYLSARRFDPADPKARKRAVAVLHEILSLTMEKRLTSDQLDVFHAEYQLPVKLLLCLVKNHGIFYITNRGAKSTVLLKDAYNGVNLIEKCPLLRFYDKFVGLGCKRDFNASIARKKIYKTFERRFGDSDKRTPNYLLECCELEVEDERYGNWCRGERRGTKELSKRYMRNKKTAKSFLLDVDGKSRMQKMEEKKLI